MADLLNTATAATFGSRGIRVVATDLDTGRVGVERVTAAVLDAIRDGAA